jgi:SAM-dependent methyltransferase
MDEIAITINSYDQIASEYCQHTYREEIRVFERTLLDKFLEYITVKNPLILDIGCGDGRDSKYLLQKGARVFSADLSQAMLEQAQRNVPDGIHLLMDARNIQLENEFLDGIWASGMIYHFPKNEVDTVFTEFHRVLKPIGVFGFNFKIGVGEGMEDNPRSYPGTPRYFAYYTLKEIREYLTLFKVLEEFPFPMEIFSDTLVQLYLSR